MSLLHLELEHGSTTGPCIGITSFKLDDNSDPHILKLHPHLVDILNTDGSTLYRFKTSNAIVAYDKIRPPGLKFDWLLILTELNTFFIVSYIRRNAKIRHKIIQSFDLNQYRVPKVVALDTDNRTKLTVSHKFLIAADQKLGRFITIHTFKGFLLLFELKPSKSNLFDLASQDKVHPDIIKNPKLAVLDKYQIIEQPVSLYIGDIQLMSLQILQSDDPLKWWVSAITKSFNLEYSLNFFLLSKPKKVQLKLECSIVIDDFPDLIIPFYGFIMLFHPTKHVIHSLPNVLLHLETSRLNLILNDNYIINELEMNNGYRKRFKAYAFQNDGEILLITSNSEFYKLSIEYHLASKLKDNSSLRRTRSQMEEDEESKLHISQWDIKDLHYRSEVTYDFNLTKIDNTYYTLNKLSRFIRVTLNDDHVTQNVKSLENALALPITSLEIQKDINFTSTDTHISYIHFKSFKTVLRDSAVKGCIQIGRFNVRYSELSVEQNGNLSMIERIEIFDEKGQELSNFDFEESSSITCLIPIKSIEPFLPDSNDFLENEVVSWNHLLSHSFLVLTTSSNEADYDKDEDFYMRRRTELFLFVIDENNLLELKAIAVLKCKIQTLLQLDQRNLLFLGENSSIRMGLTLFRDYDGDKKVHIKFSKLSEQSLGISNIAIVRKLSETLLLLVDPYMGIYLGKLNDSSQISSHQILLFPWKLINCLEVFSKDMLVLGDLMGNIILLDLVYDNKIRPNARILSSFNPNMGSIGCLVCYPPAINENGGIKVCSFGTSNGAVITVSIYQSNCETYSEFLSKTKRQLLIEHSSLENSKVNLDQIKDSKTEIQLHKWLMKMSNLLGCYFSKVTPITQSNITTYEYDDKDLPIIFLDFL